MTKPAFSASNPSARSMDRRTHDLMMPHRLLADMGGDPADPLLGTMRDGRKVHLFPQHTEGEGPMAATYYAGNIKFQDGETSVGNIELEPKNLPRDAFNLHPAVYNPQRPDSLRDLEMRLIAYDKMGKPIVDYTLTVGPDLAITPEGIRAHGYQKSTPPFRCDFWLTAPTIWPEVLVDLSLWVDDPNGTENEYEVAAIWLFCREEIRTVYEPAFGIQAHTSPTQSALVWAVPGGKLSRCTQPLQLSGSILCRTQTNPTKDNDEWLAKARFGRSRALLMPDSLDGYLGVWENVPRLAPDYDVAEAIAAHQQWLWTPTDAGAWTRQHSPWMGRYVRDAPGTDEQFSPHPFVELTADRENGRGVELLDVALFLTRCDFGNRPQSHLDPETPGEPYEFEYNGKTTTWNRFPDPRDRGNELLGPVLPGRTVHGWHPADEQHAVSAGPMMLYLTGCRAMRHALEPGHQMMLANKRAQPEVEWPGVARATGRWSAEGSCAAAALATTDQAEAAIRDVLRDRLAVWTGKTEDPGAYLKLQAIDNYGGAGSGYTRGIAWFQHGLGAQVHAAIVVFGDRWQAEHPAFFAELLDMQIACAATLARSLWFEEDGFQGGRGFGRPYVQGYTDAPDRNAAIKGVPHAEVEDSELQVDWSVPGLVSLLWLAKKFRERVVGFEDAIQRAHRAIAIHRANPSKRPNVARWHVFVNE